MNFGNRTKGEAGRLAAFARGRLKSGEMNPTEKRYAAYLDERLRAGEIIWWRFEAVKLKLAEATFYTVDFFVLTADFELQAHEVKAGMWQDDARLKIKLAQEMFPFRFMAMQAVPQSRGGGWAVEDFRREREPLLPGMRPKTDVPKPVPRERPATAAATIPANAERGEGPSQLVDAVKRAMGGGSASTPVRPVSGK